MSQLMTVRKSRDHSPGGGEIEERGRIVREGREIGREEDERLKARKELEVLSDLRVVK